MAFTQPTFNLLCNIFTVASGAHTFRLDSVCNLAFGRRVTERISTPAGPFENISLSPTLLLPAETDIRDTSCGGEGDLVEVPAGSGRFYSVNGVDDAGKGFDNEHRVAILIKAWGFPGNEWGLTSNWPTPIP